MFLLGFIIGIIAGAVATFVAGASVPEEESNEED